MSKRIHLLLFSSSLLNHPPTLASPSLLILKQILFHTLSHLLIVTPLCLPTFSHLLIVNINPSSSSFSSFTSSISLPLLPVDMDVVHARDCETKVVPFFHRKLCRDLQCFCQLLQMYSS